MSVKTTRPGTGVLAMIMIAILAWGVFHAVGAYSLNHNPWRAVVVLGFSMAFLAFWISLLVVQRNRPPRSGPSGGSKSNGLSRDET